MSSYTFDTALIPVEYTGPYKLLSAVACSARAAQILRKKVFTMSNEVREETAHFAGKAEAEAKQSTAMKLSTEPYQYYRPVSSFERTMRDVAHDDLPAFEFITGIDVSSHCRLGVPGAAELVRDASNAYMQMPFLMKLAGVEIDGDSGLNRAHLRTLEHLSLTTAERAAVKFLTQNYDALQTSRIIDTGGMIGFFTGSFAISRITMKSLQRNFEGARPTGGPIKPAEDDKGSRVDMQIHLRKAKS